MFRRLFAGQRQRPDGAARLEGEKLFELGMAHAVQFRCSEAIAFYTRSIEAHADPSPYINRANLLRRRVRYDMAMADLLAAQKLDRAGPDRFGGVIRRELDAVKLVIDTTDGGLRSKLRADLRAKGHAIVASLIACTTFDIDRAAWAAGAVPPAMARFHLWNEVDNILKFEDSADYPELRALIASLPERDIAEGLKTCPDHDRYTASEFKLHTFLAAYDHRDMQRLRSQIVLQIFQRMPRVAAARAREAGANPSGTVDGLLACLMPARAPNPVERPRIMIGGVELVHDAKGEADEEALVAGILEQIKAKCPTELDAYRYLMEECDLLSAGPHGDAIVDGEDGFFPLEYEGEAGKAEHFPDNRRCLDYIARDVMPAAEKQFGSDRAHELRVLLLLLFYRTNRDVLQALRLKYAVHYHNNCLQKGHYGYAERWAEVIDFLERT